MAVEERGAGRALEEKAEYEHDEREDELDVRAVERAAAGGRELAGDDLHAVLQVDPRDEEAEGVAWEAGHVFQEIAPYRWWISESRASRSSRLTVQRGGDPMKDRPPKIHPSYEVEVIWRVILVLKDVEDRLVENSDGP